MGMIVRDSDHYSRREINPRKDEFYLLCIDPGLDTGMAALAVSPDRVSIARQCVMPWNDGCPMISILNGWVVELSTEGSRCVLLYESFNLVSAEMVPNMVALEVIGALKVWHRWMPYGSECAEQVITRLPVEKEGKSAKGTRGVTNDVLKRLGLYAPGTRERHVRDAVRHGIGYLAEERHPWVCANGWPQRRD